MDTSADPAGAAAKELRKFRSSLVLEQELKAREERKRQQDAAAAEAAAKEALRVQQAQLQLEARRKAEAQLAHQELEARHAEEALRVRQAQLELEAQREAPTQQQAAHELNLVAARLTQDSFA